MRSVPPNLKSTAHRLRAGIIAVASAASLFTCPTHAMATTVLALSEAEQVQRADIVALGTVTANQVIQRHGMLVTLSTFAVHKGIKGTLDGDTLTVEVPGGQLGNVRTSVSGAPRFVVGDMFVGFFESHPDSVRPMGLSYGVIQVTHDYHTKKSVEDLDLLHVPGPNRKVGAVSVYGEPASDLIARLQKTAAAQARGGRP